MFDPKRVLSPLLAATAFACIASCSAAPPEDESTSATEAASSSDLQLCPVTSSAIVLAPIDSPVASCPAIPGHGGAWSLAPQGKPLACTPVVATDDGAVLCSYEWTPRTAAAPDLAALQALPDVYVASGGGGGSPACVLEATLRFAAIESLAGVQCPVRAGGGGNAPKGCDVCGKIIGPGVIWGQLVIPPPTTLDTYIVGMSNGSRQVVTVGAAASRNASSSRRSSLLNLSLPTPPRGVYYLSGPVLGYAYTTPSQPQPQPAP